MRHYQGLNDTAGTGMPVEDHVSYVFIEGLNGVNRQPSKKFFFFTVNREKCILISRYLKSHYFSRSSRTSGCWRISKLKTVPMFSI